MKPKKIPNDKEWKEMTKFYKSKTNKTVKTPANRFEMFLNLSNPYDCDVLSHFLASKIPDNSRVSFDFVEGNNDEVSYN